MRFQIKRISMVLALAISLMALAGEAMAQRPFGKTRLSSKGSKVTLNPQPLPPSPCVKCGQTTVTKSDAATKINITRSLPSRRIQIRN